MIEIRINFEGEAIRRLGLISPRMIENLDGAIKQAALLIEGTAKKKIQQGSRSGRIYSYSRGGKRPITHQASAPGEPPKTDTGRLVNSIRSNFTKLRAEVGSDVKYSAFLEVGTSKMQPRPWLISSRDENSSKIESIFNRAINEALRS